ncbi:ADP-ribosylglycohydrolase family protein [Aquibacillus saliphilus]|uniref:ADP-ribosylglycohydrolase family protein n=1 Tax=Aquibacillus saliphilus TaxID=1909422 RepID=UPI001CF00D6F|nr:ADP-ribosylglycohydrolase family protein [Aquibacillus saliphilus]
MTSLQEKVRGVILSTALGDALGAPIEKLSYEQIKDQYGRVESLNVKWYKDEWSKDLTLGRKRGFGIITDDTLMTIALMNVYEIEKRHLDAFDMGNEFIKEIVHRKQYIPEFGKEAAVIDRLFYPEKYIYMRHVLANCEPREAGIGNMVNCGAAMYIAPIGVVNAGHPKAAYDEAILFALGHQSSYGLEAAGVLAACIARAFKPNTTIDDLIDTALEYAKDGTKRAIRDMVNAAKSLREQGAGMDQVMDVLRTTIEPYSPMKDDVSRSEEKVGFPSNHYTPSRLFSIEELPMALAFIVLNKGDYYKSLYDGINSGRDTDSIGVMIGVILGALYGDKVIKMNDIEQLEKVNKLDLEQRADNFYEVAKSIINDDLSVNNDRKEWLNNSSME